MLPKKELFILLGALSIELLRMFLVDIFVLQEYFSGRSYGVFRVPIPCNGGNSSWVGAQGVRYCDDPAPYGSATKYYIAIFREAFQTGSKCPSFTTESALLDYGTSSGPTFFKGGHPRYSHLGWVIGGEFAMFYLFATFVNEVADNIFVVPTTTENGWQYKAFSVALELFQLGALCPAAIFTHGDCLQFTEPLGVSLHVIRGLIVWFGYCIWGLLVLCVPLAVIGAVILFFLACFSQGVANALVLPIRCCCGRTAATMFDDMRETLNGKLMQAYSSYQNGTAGIANGFILVSFIPLLCIGMFLGLLVVVGQGSKSGFMQILTAIVLLSDVIFKVGATILTELFDYLLHIRVRRAVLEGARPVPPSRVGRPEESEDVAEPPAAEVEPVSLPSLAPELAQDVDAEEPNEAERDATPV